MMVIVLLLCPPPGLNPGRRSEKSATNRLSYGAALDPVLTGIVHANSAIFMQIK
jgi:hypothetical protein